MVAETQGTSAAPVTELTAEQSAQIMGRLRLEGQVRSGASQFYWIAGLSLVNSILYLLNVGWSFFIGLAATQIIDGLANGIAQEMGEGGIVIRIVGLALDVFIAGMLIFFGYFANKRHMWAFVLGMILYALDGLVLLLVQDLLGVGVHILFLWFIFSGIRALRRLNAVEAGTVNVASFAPARTMRDRGYWVRLLIFPAIMAVLLLIFVIAVLVQSR